MTRLFLFTIAAVTIFSLWPVDHADARRFGGGSSFGIHHRAFPHAHARRPMAAPRPLARDNPRPRSGWMGAIAGLAMGGLLGALLFGGAFHGINLFDLLIIGAIILAVSWWFRRQARAFAWQQQTTAQPGHEAPFASGNHAYIDNRAMEEPPMTGGVAAPPHEARPEIEVGPFLDAARTIFVRMQQAWDRGDLDEIRRFCRPEFANEIARQLEDSRGLRHETETVTVDAELLESWQEAGHEWAAVRFTALMRERTIDARGGTTLEESNGRVEEVWTFCHEAGSNDPTWYLAGIAQTS
ncbi:MAG: Tim44 domain-containing protein [Zetaproteobacteria bacterium]|nr:MAG: Tim44 domain-containing protein [Zetaproteobacteria bacterium]